MPSLRISVSFLLISLVFIAAAAANDNIRSDVNGNGLVEMGDLISINEHLNEAVGEPYPPYDVKMDGNVNVLDMTETSIHYNESIPISPEISSGDGLKLKLGINGTIDLISINNTYLPMLKAQSGFSFREVLTNASNLIPNPGFENVAGAPINWNLTTSNGNTPVWDTISRTGANSIKVSIPGTTDSRSGYPQSAPITAEPLSYYTLSAWLKAEGAGGTNAPAVRVVELDSDKQWLTQTSLDFDKGTYDWTQNKITFTTGINTSYIYVYANIWDGYGTFWLDDVELSSFFGPSIFLNGTLTQNPDGTVTQKAKANDIDFTFYYMPKDRYIELQGEMQDLRGEDRALQVMFNVPVNASGWRWGDYIRGSRVINGSTHYENVYKIGDVRTQSTYPFASIDNNTLGMSIAVPMDVPRIYRKGYDLDGGYSIQYDFGLSNQTLKIGPGHANFTFVVYKTDEPEWGFRSVVKKYYELYPGFFEKKSDKEGTFIAWTKTENISNISDFGISSDLSSTEMNNLKFNTLNKINNLKYTEPWGWWRGFGNNATKPSYQARIDALNNDLLNNNTKWYGSNSFFDEGIPVKEVAQSVINSAPFDIDGKQYIDGSDYFWYSWETNKFSQNYPTNPDPDIPSPSRFNISNHEIGNLKNKTSNEGFIDNWTFGKYYSWDNKIVHKGNRSMQINMNFIGQSGRITQYINVSPNTNYTFSVWMKSENLSGAGARIVEIDPITNEYNYSLQFSIYPEKNSDWKLYTLNITSKQNTTKMAVYMNIYNGNGTVWFDDITLKIEKTYLNIISNSGFEENERGNVTNYNFDGVFVDSIMAGYAWGTLENYRTNHFSYVDIPLVYSYESKKPVILNLFSQYEYLNYIKSTEPGILSANIVPDSFNFYMHQIDAPSYETKKEYISDRILSDMRVLTNQKPISLNIQYQWYTGEVPEIISSETLENYFKYYSFYGMYSKVGRAGNNIYYWQNLSLYERDRNLFKKYIPIINNLSKAGWETIPYANIDNPNVQFERYGSNEKNNLYYTIRNEKIETQNFTLSIKVFPGIRTIRVVELLSDNMIEATQQNDIINISATIGSSETQIYKISHN